MPVTCHLGYTIEGPDHIACLSSGYWSNETKCILTGKIILTNFEKFIKRILNFSSILVALPTEVMDRVVIKNRVKFRCIIY